MLLTVELKDGEEADGAQVAICFDDDGLELLIDRLTRLRGRTDHDHLRTPSWAGHDLTEIKQGGDEYFLVNHLRFVKL